MLGDEKAAAPLPPNPELAQLRLEAAVEGAQANESSAGAGAAPGAAPAATETVEEWRDSLGMMAEFVLPVYPQLAPIWTPERLDKLAPALHRVAAKHGWSMWAFFAKWKEEIALFMVAAPFLRDTAKALRAPKPAPAAAAPGGPAAPGDEIHAAAPVEGSLKANTGAP